ncbi:hypothetical protein COCSADRAFT_82094, partial [Bipolaris sorokiniana ND90Pr]
RIPKEFITNRNKLFTSKYWSIFLVNIQIYSIFYKKLLELAPLDTKLVINIELKDDEYKIKEIKNL